MTPKPEFWSRARPLFEELVELDSDRREARLEEIRRSDPDLGETVELLLDADASDDDPLHAYRFGPPRSDLPPVDLDARDPLGIIGRTVSHFHIEDYVASGGMGVVYRAEDLQLGRVVALKFPLPHQQIDAEVKERFVREARAAASLDHPDLCPVYEIGESAHGLFLAMPLYSGETLKDRLARERSLPVGEAIRIIRQVTTALSAAHARGIVHRDLKPGNIMLLPDGSVKILDFGLAKVRDVSQTKSRATLGTLSYMAPDQIRGERVEARADLWALGVMLYEMVTGVQPFRGDHDFTLLHSILHDQPKRPSEVKEGIPQSLDRLVSALLERDSSHRYQSAEALLSDLDAVDRGAALAHRVPLWARAKRQKGVRASVVGGGIVLAFLATGAVTWRLAQSRPSAQFPAYPIQTLAVLPLANVGANPKDDYLVSGFTREVAFRLSRARGLRISGLASASAYQRRGFAPRAVGYRLGASHVIDGTVQVTGDTLQAFVELTRVSNAAVIWSQKFRAPLSDILSLQSQVADSIVRKLEPESAQSVALTDPTSDPKAFELYLKGQFLWEQRTREKEELALYYYREAVKHDSQFALAWAVMAEAYVNMQNFGFLPRTEALARANAASGRAVQLDTALAEAYAARGQLLSAVGRYAEAEAALKHAIRLDPSAPWAHHYYALLLTMLGRIDEAKAELRRTLSIDPLSVPGGSTLAILLAHQDSLKEARKEFVNALQLSPSYVVTPYYYGALEAGHGNYRHAAELLEQAMKIAPDFAGVRGALAYTYAQLGRRAEGERLIAEERTRLREEPSPVKYGLTLALVGKRDSAFAVLQRAKWDIPTLIDLRVDPLLRTFRSDPRYPELLARFQLKP